jgi:serine phosphatase RsbU (regulator of sigma subunit)
MAYLVALKGFNAKQTFPLEKDRILLGRNANCDIVFPPNDFSVSREHAVIIRSQDKFFIEDLGSRNGTYVNNQPVSARVPLKDNDRIRICDFQYSFHDDAQATRPPLPPEMGAEPTIDEPEEPSTFEASVSHASNIFLQSLTAEKFKVFIEIINSLRNTLQLDQLLPKIVDNLFQLFKQADRCFIILREEVQERDRTVERLIPKVIKTRRAQDETSANYSRSIVRECLKRVEALLSEDATSDKRFNMSQSIADFRIRSVMCAPFSTQDGKAFGVVQLDTQDRSKKFTAEDLHLLMTVAGSASVALENARLHEDLVARERLHRDLELAHQVQLSFLPQQLPTMAGYDFYAAYEPAQEVGGDYYGFIPLTNPQPRGLAIMLGDVAGKGIAAALLMAKLSSDARFSLLSQTDPGQAIGTLNDLLCQHFGQMDRFVTLAAALLDPSSHTVTFVNAGHPSPLIYRRATGQLEEASTRDTTGLPLGVVQGYVYEPRQLRLEPGDAVFLFSDGVTEAMDTQNNQLQLRAIQGAFKDGPQPPHLLGERVVRAVRQHAAGRSQHDDITLVCFGRTGA